MAWYRTYRPQTITDLHTASIREVFERMRDSGSFNHAYLFAGPKGIGKTSSARILAKLLNCEQNAQQISSYILPHSKKKALKNTAFENPCGTCSSCVHITNGSSLSVTETDAASNRGIDDIRVLRERVHIAPSDGRVGVYIIDEVHMLTTEAFNALLKVLEEPPKHVVFILATTELHKVPETIISRCIVIHFQKAKRTDLVSALTTIVKQEGILPDTSVLEAIADLSDGSFRDAVKMLEHISLGKKRITVDDVEQNGMVGIAGYAQQLVSAVVDKNTQEVISLFQTMESADISLVQVQKNMIGMIHERLVHAVNEQHRNNMLYFSWILSELNTAVLPQIPVPSLPFELACIRVTLEKNGQENRQEKIPSLLETKNQDRHEEKRTTDHNLDLDSLSTQWEGILNHAKLSNASLEALLRATRPLTVKENLVTIEVFYSFHKEQLESNRFRTIIQDLVRKATNNAQAEISFVLGKKPVSVSAQTFHAKTQEDEELVQAAEEVFL